MSFKKLLQKLTQANILICLIYSLRPITKSDLALFQININSLQFQFDELGNFLANCPIDFQILDITEFRLKEANLPTANIILPGFTYEHMSQNQPMEVLYFTLK